MLRYLLVSGLARGSAVVLNMPSANAETFAANYVFVIPIGTRSTKLGNDEKNDPTEKFTSF